MRHRTVLAIAMASLMMSRFLSSPDELQAQVASSKALDGVVSSQEEGRMEGVVVTAHRGGSNVAVSVVTDAKGQYSFPRTHLEPGMHAVTIRAVGYDLSEPASVDVAANKAANLDLKLRKTKDLATQLNSLEWITSVSGTDAQKDMVVMQGESCAYCHSLERIVKSKHTADQFVGVIRRMAKYYADGSMASSDGRGRAQLRDQRGIDSAEKSEIWGFSPGVQITELSKYLATINLSDGKTLPSSLKMLPRPKGQATRVVVTQYYMPRQDTVPHDMEIDAQGTPWYTDESRMFFGKMDPKTGAFTEYPLPPVPAGDIPGARDITIDKEGNPWFPMRLAGGASRLTKFDIKTETLTTVADGEGQFVTTGADGKIWVSFTRIDPKTMKVDGIFPWNSAPNLPPGPHNGYQNFVDSMGNPYVTDFIGSYIVSVDVRTGAAKFWPTPTRGALPRRGRMDPQDRLWFAEYGADKIAMLDTRTDKIQEWAVPIRYTTPYTVSVPDRNGRVYSPSNTSDCLLRLDPKTGEVIYYLMPTNNFDPKKLAMDPTASRPTIWMANTRNASLIKVEPLD